MNNEKRKQRQKELQKVCEPVKEFLYECGNPHSTVIITQANAEMLSGEVATRFELKD